MTVNTKMNYSIVNTTKCKASQYINDVYTEQALKVHNKLLTVLIPAKW
jgi:hypothetical protein